MKRYRFLLSVGCATLLSACGGGGGGGTTGTAPSAPAQTSTPAAPTPAAPAPATQPAATSTPAPSATQSAPEQSAPPSTPAPTSTLTAITAQNFSGAASNAYNAATSLRGAGLTINSFLSGVSATPAGGDGGVVSPMFDLLERAFGPGRPPLLTGITYSEPCLRGGTVDYDLKVTNENTLSNGDVISVAARNCVEDNGTINGEYTVAASGVTGTPLDTGTGTATLDVVFKNFGVVPTGNPARLVSGDMRLALNYVDSVHKITSLTGKSLQETVRKDGAAVATYTMSDYALSVDRNGPTGATASTYAFTVVGTTAKLGDFKYTVKTAQPFVADLGRGPQSGTMIVAGTPSTVTIGFADAGTVRLDYSAKGDGVVTQTTTKDWFDFGDYY
jgi:hypothetical protein